MTELLHLENYSFTYPQQRRPALSHVTLTVPEGAFMVLCGPSGCGKSTLLRQLKTALAPHGLREGEITFCGTPLAQIPSRRQAAEIGFVQQSPENQVVTDKVWHELAFGLESLGFDTPTIRRRVAEMASFFGIQDWFYKNVTELSGGQKQLLSLASVMVMQPRVLILDEPTSQLDPIAASDFLQTLGRINRELGTTVLLTEHRLEEALPLATHAAVMDGGRLLCTGTPAEVGGLLRQEGHRMFLCPLPHHPKQREFARLNVTHTVMSKRYLRQLVFEKHVEGWDDPRMPTLCALRRRGYTPSAILDFVQRAGIAKANSLVDIKLLEHCIREELNETALRRMAVTEPVKLVITNYPEGQCEEFEVPNNPRNEEAGSRKVPFTRELYIEKSDFAEVPPPKFQRLKPDGEVRLMGAYIVKCNEIVKDDNGEIVEIRCTADLETRNGMPVDGRKVKGTIHWVSAEHAIDADLYLYDNLFTLENVNDVPEGTDYLDYLNPDSLKKLTGCKLEPSLADAKEGERFQFVRMGYYCKDRESGRFNRIVTLKDGFAKTLKK